MIRKIIMVVLTLLVVVVASLIYMKKNLVLIGLEKGQIVITIGGQPVEDATITVNKAFTKSSLHLDTGTNYVELRQVTAEDKEFLTAGEVLEIRIVGVRDGRWLDTTAEFSHDARFITVQRISWNDVKPE